MKKIFVLFPIFLLLFTLTMNSCTKAKILKEKHSISLQNIQNGDLIFVGAQTEELSGAINRVTKINDETNFDHVGLIEKTTDSIFVFCHGSSSTKSIRMCCLTEL